MVCPVCKSTKTVKIGFRVTSSGKKQRIQCQDCAKTFYQDENKLRTLKE